MIHRMGSHVVCSFAAIFIVGCTGSETNRSTVSTEKRTPDTPPPIAASLDNLGSLRKSPDCKKINQQEFDAALAEGGRIDLPPCSIVTLSRATKIPDNIHLTTSKTDPARIVRSQNSSYGLVVNGSNITIEHVVIDFNTGAAWKDFLAAISFKPPAHIGGAARIIDQVTIDNVSFVDSMPPKVRTGRGDNWAISLSNETETGLSNILLRSNRLENRPHTQLVANGYGKGIDGLEIVDNFVRYGESNAIAVSSKVHKSVFRNITIDNNQIIDADRIGIFVGRDASSGIVDVLFENVCISNNRITMKPRANYPSAVYLRGLANTGLSTPSIWFFQNKIDVIGVESMNPRFYSLIFNPDAWIATYQNEYSGNGDRIKSDKVLVTELQSLKRVSCYRFERANDHKETGK